jgi:hypothetical protein
MLRAKSLITTPQPLRPHNIKMELGGANKAITRVAGLADSRPRYRRGRNVLFRRLHAPAPGHHNNGETIALRAPHVPPSRVGSRRAAHSWGIPKGAKSG